MPESFDDGHRPPRIERSKAFLPGGARDGGGTPDAVALRHAFMVVRRHVWLVLAVTACTLGAAVFLALREPPEYRASAVVRLEDRRRALTGGIEDAIQLATEPRTVDPVLSLIERLRSRQVVGVVVDSLGMRLKSASPDFSNESLVAVHVDSKAPSDSIKLRFRKQEVVARTRGQEIRVRYGQVLGLGGVHFVVPARPDVEAALLAVVPREQEIDRVLGKIELIQREATDVVDVAYTATNPLVAQRVINTFIQTFQTINIRAAQEQSRLRGDFLSTQLRQTDSLLARAQANLGAFRSRQELASSGDKLAATQASLLAIDAQREQLKADRRTYGDLPELLRSSNDSVGDEALRSLAYSPEMASNPVISRLSQNLIEYKVRLDSFTTGPWRSTAADPDVLELQGIIESSKQELISAVASQVRSLDARIEALGNLRARSGASIQALPALEAEEMRLAAQVEALSTMGAQLRQEVQKAGLSEAVEVGDMQVVHLADVPYVSAWATGWLKIGMGLLAGLIVGGGAAYLLEANDTSVRRPEDLEEMLQVTGLAIIPRVAVGPTGLHRFTRLLRGANRHHHGRGLHRFTRLLGTNGHQHRRRKILPQGLVTLSEPQSIGTEAFRMLRTSLVWSDWGRKLKTIVVTSVAPGEGKTLTAANLGVIFAREGMRVLLVDGDLRRARLHKIFRTSRDSGLAELIKSDKWAGEAVSGGDAAMPIMAGNELHSNIRMTAVEGLSLLPAGMPSRSLGTFREARVRRLLREVANVFDLVIVDAPPVLATADAAILASMADGVLFVVRAGRTDRRAIQHAYQQLLNVGAQVVGTVLNDPQGELQQVGEYYYVYEYPEVKD